MTSTEEPLEPLKYQTIVLKVPIHCEGCKKKVKRVLQTIDGVYKITIDSHLHKVTVTANVEPDILTKKLHKYGKQAEVWPEPKPNPETNNGDGTGKKKKKKKKKNTAAAAGTDTTDKNNPPPAASDDDSSSESSCESPTPEANIKEVTITKAIIDIPMPQQQPSQAAAAAAGSGKKKKKKKKKSNKVITTVIGAEASNEDVTKGNVVSGSEQMPRISGYDYPAYVMSYNAVQPSYGAAGYFPAQPSSYVYTNQSYGGTYYIPTTPTLPATDDVFSEENANSCGIM